MRSSWLCLKSLKMKLFYLSNEFMTIGDDETGKRLMWQICGNQDGDSALQNISKCRFAHENRSKRVLREWRSDDHHNTMYATNFVENRYIPLLCFKIIFSNSLTFSFRFSDLILLHLFFFFRRKKWIIMSKIKNLMIILSW